MPEETASGRALSAALSRRALLGAAAGLTIAGAGNGAAGARAAVRAADPPVTEQRERVVIVGSGFGGGVSALRLAQAGVEVLVLERGLRWVTGPNSNTFATLKNFDRRTTWLDDHSSLPGMPSTKWKPYTGIIETSKENGMTVNCAAAVGGGSVNYHGMTLQPSEANFARSIPMMAGDYGVLNAAAYPTVARMLGISTIPDDILKTDPYKSSRLFLDVAPKTGLQTFRVPLPVDWSYVRGELNGTYNAAYTNSDIAFGVNNGGKHSIDVTYLKAAEATGKVRVATLHLVKDVELRADKKWVLHVDRIDTDGVVQERKKIIADAVFLNAGSIGTTRLMVKAKAKGLIPNLPDAVGTGWGTNGDRIYAWIGMNGDAGTVQGGPACVGGRDPNASLPYTIIHAGSPSLPGGIKLVTLVGFGIVPAVGSWKYNAAADTARLTWPGWADAQLLSVLSAKMNQFSSAGGGLVIDTNTFEPSTWHSLGGVPMGGAVDRYGRVLGHKGLYVTDGSRIPGSTGACNPSMTIAALAEHSLYTITRNDVGKVF